LKAEYKKYNPSKINNPKTKCPMHTIVKAITDQQITMCWEAIQVLRPTLDFNNYVSKIKEMQKEGYQLIYIKDENKVVSIAGYRIYTMLYAGKILYIDDLSTLEIARGKGFASQLLKHLEELALTNNCTSMHLDSGPQRTVAHKLYFNENFTISSFHFSKPLK
jgi:GNAT superfamily N-acetyltransferase